MMLRALAVALLLALPLAACNEDGSSTGSDDSAQTGMGRMVATAPMSTEIFIDQKPDTYAFAGETHKMTGAEVVALAQGQ